MPHISFVHPDGRRDTVAANTGDSAMYTALAHGIDGIVAECGGGAVCATCHVYVEETWFAKLPPPGLDEDELLEGTAAERKANSRLSCQIKISDELDGLTLILPPRQV